MFAIVNGFEFVELLPDYEERFWRYVAKEIHNRPKYVAKMTGLEQIGYLTDLKPPEKLPTFDAVIKVWETHSTTSRAEVRKVTAAFRAFVAGAAIKTINDITPESCVAYRNKVFADARGGKYQQHLFTRARRMLTFAQSQAMAVQPIETALTAMKLLKPRESTVTLDPKPISRGDFHKLLGKATGDDRAMLLLMLNCALYLEEVRSLKWTDISEGKYLLTHRKKNGRMLRVAVLWQENIDALATIKHRGDSIFYSKLGFPISIQGAEFRLRKLRTAAGLTTDVSASHLRDGAFTAAVAAGVNSELSRVLVGHRSGLADNYVKRRPEMVAPACQAIYAAYMASQ